MGSMSRRDILRATGMASLGASFSACASRRPFPAERTRTAERLPRVRVDEERIIRTVVGLRPYRPSGFVVRAEKLGDKTLVHNYGHGGGGITLSWGTSELAVDEAWGTGERRFAVLGCGAVGLATARLLQQRGGEVTIYAKDLPPHTTSNIAGGQWSPTSVMDAQRRTAQSDALLARVSRLSHRSYQQLPAVEYGIRWLPNYILSDQPVEESWEQSLIRDLFPQMRTLRPDEHPFAAPYARRFMTLLVEPHVYLHALLRDVRLSGARVVVGPLQDREQVLKLPEPVVMNCTGLGAKALFGDEELEPVRGQLTFLLPQPEVDYIVISSGLYMFPRRDGILLGGTFEHGDWNLEPDGATRTRIVAGHRALFDAMR